MTRRLMVDARNLVGHLFSLRYDRVLLDGEDRTPLVVEPAVDAARAFKDAGYEPVFVLDGDAPRPKKPALDARKAAKKDRQERAITAMKEGREGEARRLAHGAMRLMPTDVEAAKNAWREAGYAVLQAAGEAEAEAAVEVVEGRAWALASADFDAFLFGAPRVLRRFDPRSAVTRLEDVLRATGARSRLRLVEAEVLSGRSDYAPAYAGVTGYSHALALLEHAGGMNGMFVRHCVSTPNLWTEARDIYLKPNARLVPC